MLVLWLLLGLAGAALYLRLGRGQPLAWWAIGLAVVAGVYVASALARGDLHDALTEAGGLVVYGSAAWLGVRRQDARIVGAAWALHPAWDVGMHVGLGLEAPAWYVWSCLSFDLVVGTALIARARWSR